nr:EOG090X0LZH [Cyclestheria hislopi]
MEKRLLRVLKDRSFLLDILMQHENDILDINSTEEDATDSSDGESKLHMRANEKKKKLKVVSVKKGTGIISKPKKKSTNKPEKVKQVVKMDSVAGLVAEEAQSAKHLAGHMTPEEVERHLESRRAQQSQLEFAFAPDKAPPTVPTEMFSTDLDGTANFMEFLDEIETSPSNAGDEHLAVEMEHH